MAEHADRLTYTLSLERHAGALRHRLHRGGHAADLLGRRRPLARDGRGGRAGAGRRRRAPRPGDEEHRAGRHRRAGARRARRPRARAGGLLLQPGVPEGGRRDRRLPPARPGRDRRLRPRPRRPRGRPLRAARRHDRAHHACRRRRWSSTRPTRSSPRRSRFINEIANVCEEVGADVDVVAHGMGLDRAHRPGVPARRHRLRRQLLPEGRVGAQAARGQLGLPLPAAHLGHRGQRAAEAARHREAEEAPRRRWRASGSPCSG